MTDAEAIAALKPADFYGPREALDYAIGAIETLARVRDAIQQPEDASAIVGKIHALVNP